MRKRYGLGSTCLGKVAAGQRGARACNNLEGAMESKVLEALQAVKQGAGVAWKDLMIGVIIGAIFGLYVGVYVGFGILGI